MPPLLLDAQKKKPGSTSHWGASADTTQELSPFLPSSSKGHSKAAQSYQRDCCGSKMAREMKQACVRINDEARTSHSENSSNQTRIEKVSVPNMYLTTTALHLTILPVVYALPESEGTCRLAHYQQHRFILFVNQIFSSFRSCCTCAFEYYDTPYNTEKPLSAVAD